MSSQPEGMRPPTRLRLATQAAPSRLDLLIFDTHPIQYRSPVFRALKSHGIRFQVLFFNETFDANNRWLNEVGQIPKQTWGLPLKDGYENATLNTREASLTHNLRWLWRNLHDRKPRAILIYGYYQWEHWAVRIFAGALNLPILFVGETFSAENKGLRGWIKKPLLKLFFGGITQFLSIGNKTELHYRNLGIQPQRITPAKYCVDGSFFKKSETEKANGKKAFRLALGIPDDAFVLLFVGRLYDRKRPLDLIKIHDGLKKEKNIHTVIVGNGDLESPLKEKAKADPTFHFLGFQDQAGTREAYHAADLLIVPSVFETWGLVVNEAFYCGLPALVTETCGVAGDLVISDVTGFIYPMGDIDSAMGFVKRALSDPKQFEKLRLAALKKVDLEYGVEQFAEAISLALVRAAGKL